MEAGKALSVNSIARVEHVEVDAPSLNAGFEKLAAHLKQNSLAWPQLLASAYDGGKCRIMFTADGEFLDSALRSFEKSPELRQHRPTLSSVTVTCYGGVNSDLPHRALQILSHHGITADKYILSPHSVSLFIPPRAREAAVRALHSLIESSPPSAY